ncbi:Oligosaccaryltransferase-domain-containing protein [Durotheca rogersii]|uniref:Oligosaccaryltransferase-domain-containing protein n=1 Tax=Durotheca rogersii TaxID=419775 RepID=UPI0022212787|nr:Oligosaccaryltransferase-domain-containing protein [Durotheca rogersii]KAI5863488.1 Oligosaccaryltransferase-domain-containing protein [Durotheca rogersii]
MISDNDLYQLAISLGSLAMVMIVVYHFIEVNSGEDGILGEKAAKSKPEQQPAAVGKPAGATK